MVDDTVTPIWHARAACAGLPTEMFFPTNLRSGQRHDWGPAREVCIGCPAREECLEHAMRIERSAWRTHRHGMWGGLTPDERHRLEADRRRAGRERRCGATNQE